jgi:hypothetical protein
VRVAPKDFDDLRRGREMSRSSTLVRNPAARYLTPDRPGSVEVPEPQISLGG